MHMICSSEACLRHMPGKRRKKPEIPALKENSTEQLPACEGMNQPSVCPSGGEAWGKLWSIFAKTLMKDFHL